MNIMARRNVEVKNIELLEEFVTKYDSIKNFEYFLDKLVIDAMANFWAIGISRQESKDKKDHYIWHKNNRTPDKLIIELSNTPV